MKKYQYLFHAWFNAAAPGPAAGPGGQGSEGDNVVGPEGEGGALLAAGVPHTTLGLLG